jgi:hypothetical protein
MTGIEIDLSKPFESFLATVLSLPADGVNANGSANEEEIRQATRFLYEAAHGRVVETSMGAIPIAPAVAASLKTEPFFIHTRSEFLRLAETKGGFRPGARAVVAPRPQFQART